MRSASLTRAWTIGLLGCLASYGSCALADEPWLSRIEQELRSTIPEDGEASAGTIQFVVGDGVWQPGNRYANGDDWLALTCSAQGCALEPASLKVTAESWQGHYDDQPTSGQKLNFKRPDPLLTVKKAAPSNGETLVWSWRGLSLTLPKATPAAGGVVAWLRTTGAPRWLAAGAVPTYYSPAMPLQKPATAGTLETLVTLPAGASATLVPMLLRAEPDSGTASDFLLQLRSGNRRQFLAGRIATCSKAVSPNYLLWAGDLDRDGKPDYLVTFVDADGPVHLYLSGRARGNYLVGLGGSYDAPPNGGECDTMGWLE